MIRAKGLKKKAIAWAYEGDIKNMSNLEEAVKQITAFLEAPPPPKPKKKEDPYKHSPPTDKRDRPPGMPLKDRPKT